MQLKPQVTFQEDIHKYYHYKTGEEYISCTTLIHKFVPEFDKEKWSNIVATRDGKTPEQVREEWSKIAKQATDFGTLVHNGIEDFFNNEIEDSEYYEIIKNGYESITSQIGDDNIIPEMLLWNHKYKIAGQSDIVQIDHDRKIINIGDHKTNKKLDFASKYDEYMFSPVQHLMNCSYNTYALQLSMYAYMLEQLYPGYKIGRLFLNHYDRCNGWVIYPVPYLKLEVMCILREYEKQHLVNN